MREGWMDAFVQGSFPESPAMHLFYPGSRDGWSHYELVPLVEKTSEFRKGAALK
jgi:hypothetical protein